MYYLKNIGWYLDQNKKLFFYKVNPKLEKEIRATDTDKVFAFIKNLKTPVTEQELRNKNKNLNDEEFNEIKNFFIEKSGFIAQS